MSANLIVDPERKQDPVAPPSVPIRDTVTAGHGPYTRPRQRTFIVEDSDRGKQYAQPRLDVDAHYPPDRHGEAAGENGRVWKIYRDRVKDIDEDLLESWNDTLNMLLVFAGLFSAACTAFLIEVTKNLQPDWQRATSLTVFAIYIHLNSTSPAPFEVPNPMSFASPSDARWINGLWFTSLTLSLAVSLLAILAKQWLNEFKSRMRAPIASPKMWAMRHSAFKGGLDRWGMDTFIATLPLLLHASLFLFLAGLCLLLLPVDSSIALIVISLTSIVGVFYFVTGLAPVIWGDCPTATPVLRHVYSVWHYAIGPALRWIFLILYLVLIVCPGLALFCLPHAAWVWCRKREWHFPRGPVANALVTMLDLLTVEQERIHAHALWRYRPKAFAAPAFDQARVLGGDEPLREASVLAWMIRTLPVDADVNSAICAVGWLAAGAHHAYFHARKQVSPLKHEAMQRAAVDVLDDIAVQTKEVDDTTTATILRACLFVAVKPLELNLSTQLFLKPYAQLDTQHDPHGLRSLSFSALHSDQDWPHESGQQLANLRIELAELIALSGFHGRHRTRLITRLAVMASEIADPRHPLSIVSVLESEILEYWHCRLSGWSPRLYDDPRLRFIAALDAGLRHPRSLQLTDGERQALVSSYGAAARSLVADSEVKLPPDLQHRLHLTTNHHFNEYQFSVPDLNAIGTLLTRKLSEDRTSIHPVALSCLLAHFQHLQLPVLPETLEWVQAAFALPSGPVSELQKHRTARLALHNSHLSLLRHVKVPPRDSTQSAWGRLLDLVPISDFEEHLAELAYPYTVQLLVLHRSGHVRSAQTRLHELLPIQRGASIISRGFISRFHLALHGKLICHAWWADMRARLQDLSPTEWTPCSKYPNAISFVDALSGDDDCLTCTHENELTRWRSNPRLLGHRTGSWTSELEAPLTVSVTVDQTITIPCTLPSGKPVRSESAVVPAVGDARGSSGGGRVSDVLLESGLLPPRGSSS